MLETNIRLLGPGRDIYLRTRLAATRGSDRTPDLLQKGCGSLRYRYGIAAVPVGAGSSDLLVVASDPIRPVHLEADDWELYLEDSGEATGKLTLDDAQGPGLLTALVERLLEARLARTTDLWTLGTPRIWYEPEPFTERDGIAAYRRYEIAAISVEGAGIGVAVDIGTAFFTVESLAYYFRQDLPPDEALRRSERFSVLTKRQAGQKGTLVYDNGRSRTACYFESAPPGVTCASTGTVRVKGNSYESLQSYYGAEYPDLDVSAEAPVVRVSFAGLARPQYIAADRVRALVMNEDVPERLSSVDKVSPLERRDLLTAFWDRLGNRPFGSGGPAMQPGFWRPGSEHAMATSLPALVFGKGCRLDGPTAPTASAYRAYFQQRGVSLGRSGCYGVPPGIPRVLHCAYPEQLERRAIERFACDVTEAIHAWTGVRICPDLTAYQDIDGGTTLLRSAAQSGVVLFALNDEPVAYHEVAFQLQDWRIKRVTEHTLSSHYDDLTNGAWDRRTRSRSRSLGSARWRSFVTQSALDLLQVLDVIPFRTERAGPYEAHLVVDVGHDRRHLAVSLLVSRPEAKRPSFRLVTQVQSKADHQHEAINGTILRDQVIELVQSALPAPSDPLASLVVLRDGRLAKQEVDGIDQALEALMGSGKVSQAARVDFAELHKDTLKSLRLWDVADGGAVSNPLEGTAVRLNAQMVLLATTGAGTLHQGTADPMLIVGNGRCSSVVDVAQAVLDGAQLNWSSPGVAQRLHIALKRTDEELKARAAQEIRRLR